MKRATILVIALFAIAASAQTPQGAVMPSAKQCKDTTVYNDQAERYRAHRWTTTIDGKGAQCVELLDTGQGDICRIWIDCGAT